MMKETCFIIFIMDNTSKEKKKKGEMNYRITKKEKEKKQKKMDTYKYCG